MSGLDHVQFTLKSGKSLEITTSKFNFINTSMVDAEIQSAVQTVFSSHQGKNKLDYNYKHYERYNYR